MNNSELYEKYKDKNHRAIDGDFVSACQLGFLDKAKYLLHSQDLPINANINVHNGMAFQYACYYCQLEVVKYLLTAPELNGAVNIRSYKKPFELIEQFIISGNIDAVNFLMSSDKDIFKLSKVAEFAIKNFNKDNLELTQYLIFDLNIKKSKPIDRILSEFPNSKVEKMFELREINHGLNKELISTEEKNKKFKI